MKYLRKNITMVKRKKQTKGVSVEKPLEQLDVVLVKKAELEEKEKEYIDEIRRSKQEAVVAFIDLVGSTEFKNQHKDEPEVWILRLKKFLKLIAAAVEKYDGAVVKYIGDEVMAAFKGPERFLNANNFLNHLKYIQDIMQDSIGYPTEMKTSIDAGEVYFFEQEGHLELDPQGTPVDRAARIAKFSEPGTILSSHDFVKNCKTAIWNLIGESDLKGIGSTDIYQFSKKTVSIEKKIEIPEAQIEGFKAQIAERKKESDNMSVELNNLKVMNEKLHEQLLEAEAIPDEENVYQSDEESPEKTLRNEIEVTIKELNDSINKCGANEWEYACFLFCYSAGNGRVEDHFNDLTFESCRNRKLVIWDDGQYILNESHPKVSKSIRIMGKLSDLLREYEDIRTEIPEDEEYPFELDNDEFWEEMVGYSVTN